MAPHVKTKPLVAYDAAGADDSNFMLKLCEVDSMKVLSDILLWLTCQWVGFCLFIVSKLFAIFDPDE